MKKNYVLLYQIAPVFIMMEHEVLLKMREIIGWQVNIITSMDLKVFFMMREIIGWQVNIITSMDLKMIFMMKNIVLFNILMDLIVLFTMKIINDNDHRDANKEILRMKKQ